MNRRRGMTNSTPADHNSPGDAHTVASADTPASSGDSDPLWLLVAASALFFAFAAALLASG
jgi:hypothetical protein